MARNKYPEVTVERILDVSQRLFLEKGYENTTIQDIVDELGGLTKGAVYHHFKSKEEIMDAVGDRMFFSNNPFEAVRGRTDLNGPAEAAGGGPAQPVGSGAGAPDRPVDSHRQKPPAAAGDDRLQPQGADTVLSGADRGGQPRRLDAHQLSPGRSPSCCRCSPASGLLPSVYPASREQMKRKFLFLGEMLEKMGVPLMDDSIRALVDDFFDQIPEELPGKIGLPAGNFILGLYIRLVGM